MSAASVAVTQHTLLVDKRGSIKDFVKAQGIAFATGSGYYELTKAEDISPGKQIVVQEKRSKAFLTGDKVREVLGIPANAKKYKLDPAVADDFVVFVQSTSHNRVLEAGTHFLYEVEAVAAPAPAADEHKKRGRGKAPAAAAPVVAAPAPAPVADEPKKRGRGKAPAAAAAAAPVVAAPAPAPAADEPKKRGRGKAAAAPAPVAAPVAAPAEAETKKRGRGKAAAAPAAAPAAEPAAPAEEPPAKKAKVDTPVAATAAEPATAVPMEGVAEAGAARGPAQKVEIVFSFDTTGSMYPCLGQLRKNLRATIARLLTDVPNIRVGVIAHGDYCDGANVIKTQDLTNDVGTLVDFVENAPPTGGGDADECYELVLRDVRKFKWSPDADQKSLILIGDNNPHPAAQTPEKIDWRVECGKLKEAGIRVHAVQALNYKHATAFYRDVAYLTNGIHCNLDQFAYISDFVMALTLGEYSQDAAAAYESELKGKSSIARSLHRLFDQVLGRASSSGISADGTISAGAFDAVTPGRFQVMDVDHDMAIKEFAESNGLIFKAGKGFYEFTKSEVIQATKEIVLMDKASGDMYTGDKARELLGLVGADPKAKVKPVALDKYRVFVQSTSYNRKLVGGTGFLYEVDSDK